MLTSATELWCSAPPAQRTSWRLNSSYFTTIHNMLNQDEPSTDEIQQTNAILHYNACSWCCCCIQWIHCVSARVHIEMMCIFPIKTNDWNTIWRVVLSEDNGDLSSWALKYAASPHHTLMAKSGPMSRTCSLDWNNKNCYLQMLHVVCAYSNCTFPASRIYRKRFKRLCYNATFSLYAFT